MEKASIPASLILDTAEIRQGEQAHHRNMIVEVDHSTVGKTATLEPAVKLSKSPTSVRRAAIQSEAGYGDDEIADFLDSGVTEAPANA
jgi:crotonobetainyl-CoA:carnitine CoA-transferase CaiB-like acyl-CoA transferase